MTISDDPARITEALHRTPGWAQAKHDLDDATTTAILDEAARFAQARIAPLNAVGDRHGMRFQAGQVLVPPGFREAYRDMATAGWLGLEHALALGGQGLPITMFVAVNQMFERAAPAFMMAAGASRAAALLLAEWGDAATRDDWVPALLAGEACATICISEPEAGSDVGRIRTRAFKGPDGWRVSGQKIWISFGDHDMADRIGHCLLARTGDAPGTRGLSLFLVPRGSAVRTERIEEKLGLHGSPTCALDFSEAPAVLLGEQGRGLPQLFTMIRHMRLMVACQGLGVAQGCLDVATTHARDRRQGGGPEAPPVPLISHADVRRQLRRMGSATALFRLALMQTAVAADLSADPHMARLCAFLLPLVKNFGAELGFDTASRSVMVLGGIGYTRDYPVEQALRDARVFAIYEGTTGMQAQDFALRQCMADGGKAIATFVTLARAECGSDTLAIIEDFATFFADKVAPADRAAQVAMAEPVMRAGWVAVQAWMAARVPETDAADFFMATAREEMALHLARARAEAAAR